MALLRLATAALVAVSGWLAAGTLAVGDSDVRVRLGVVPAAWLAILLCAAVAAALAWRRATPAALAAAGVSGFCALPWIPLAPAAALLWTGPLALVPWVAAAVSGAGLARASTASRAAAAARAPRRSWLRTEPAAPCLAFAAALAVYAGGYALVSERHPLGDEPHYLIIAHSLVHDRDLRIEDNHQRGDYAAFAPAPLPPDFLRRGTDGAIYSIHAPGLPVLVLPAYALLGAVGAVGWLVVIAACGAGLLWSLAYQATGDAAAAWVGWAGAALAAPFVLHAGSIFPDAPASVLVLVGLRGVLRAAASRPLPGGMWWALTGSALALLPWLHTRYAILAGVLGVAIGVVLLRRRDAASWPALAWLATVPAVAAAGWFAYFWRIYGTLDPSAPYGGYTQTAWSHVGPGVTGLLVDGQFGLLATAPILAWAAVGLGGAIVPRAREDASDGGRRSMALVLAALCGTYLAAAGAYAMWWGGDSAPARFAVPLVLPLGLPLAFAWTAARSTTTRALMVAALAAALLLTVALLVVDGGRLAYGTREGSVLWAVWASPVVDLALALPRVHRGGTGLALAQAALWIGAAGATWLLLRGLERRAGARAVIALTPLACGLGVTAAVAGAWAVVDATPWLPSSQAGLLAAPRWRAAQAVVTSGGAGADLVDLATPADLVRLVRLEGVPRGGDVLAFPPLPAGRYVVEAVEDAGPGWVVRIGEAPLEAGRLGRDGLELRLPVGIPRWTVVSAATSTAGLPSSGRGSVVVRALEVFRGAAALRGPGREIVRGSARQVVAYGDLRVFFLDDGVYPEGEGFWLGPGRESTVVVGAPAGTGSLRVAVRNVPVPNRVEVRAGRWRDALALGPGAAGTLEVPGVDGEGAAVLRFRAAGSVRPADVDPQSGDRRPLAAWIRLERW